MDNINVQTGIQYFGSGNKTGALQIFLEVLKREPNNEIAWLWLAACVDKPEQKRDCFHKVLSINPSNLNAQKALAELELQTISDSRPVPKSGSVLKCPSCGSVMGKPDHTGLVQCSYCGTAITYDPPAEKVEQKNIERYLEICNSSLEGKNYEETLLYANKVLEIDPKNSSAWINKGIATSWLTTSKNNRYDEAMGYLRKAEELSPDNDEIQKIKDKLTYEQAYWYVHLGSKKEELGDEIYNIYDNYIDAQAESIEHFHEAMNYYLSAAAYFPADTNILSYVEKLAKRRGWIYIGETANKIIKDLQILRAKPEAEQKLPKLKAELLQTQKELEKLKKEKGFFSGFKIDDVQDKVTQLKGEILKCEKIIAHTISQ